MVDVKYWEALEPVPRLGTVRLRRLEAYFGDLKKVWHAGLYELKEAGLADRTARDLIALRSQTTSDAELEKLKLAGFNLATWYDDDYPKRLKEIADPPPVSY